jgi:hypothetical protein
MRNRVLAVTMVIVGVCAVGMLRDPVRVRAQSRQIDPIDVVRNLEGRVADLQREFQRDPLVFTLLDKLETAITSLERNNTVAAVGSLLSFQNEVRAHRSLTGELFVYVADSLVAQAHIAIKGIADPGFLLVADPNNLFYLGGTITESPSVFITYWGWGPNHDDPKGQNPVLEGFLAGIGGTPYLETMTQYYMTDPAAPGGRTYIKNLPGLLKGVWYDDIHARPDPLSGSDIEKEVRESTKHFGYNKDAIYFIATPPDRTWNQTACAYHASASNAPYTDSIIYVDLPYQPNVCQIGLSEAAVTTVIAFHELAEAMNDPRYGDVPLNKIPGQPFYISDYPSNFGWLDKNGAELGDICGTLQGFPAKSITLNGTAYSIQALWSNADHGCVYSSP